MEFQASGNTGRTSCVSALVVALASLLPASTPAAEREGHERPGPRTLNGRYTRLDIQWQQLWARVESGEMPAPEKSLVDHTEEVGKR